MKSSLLLILTIVVLCLTSCSKNIKKDINSEQELPHQNVILKKIELKKSWHNFLQEGGKIVTKD